MKGWQASDRWGCSHTGDQSCPWCANPDGEVWRDVSSYVPMYGIPIQQQAPSSTLAEYIESISPGFFERSAGVS